jgi:hypothetical protein
MVNLIAGTSIFFSQYFLQILLMFLVLCLITIYMTIHNVHFVKSKPQLERVATIEAFESPFFDKGNNLSVAFSEDCKSDPYKCHERCKSIGEIETCGMTSSCVWTHSKPDKDGEFTQQCVAGNDLGATFNAGEYLKTFFKGKEL